MNLYKEIIYRLRAGESERGIARDLGLSHTTVHKYHIKAELKEYLNTQHNLPESQEIQKSMGPAACHPKTPRHFDDDALLLLPLCRFE